MCDIQADTTDFERRMRKATKAMTALGKKLRSLRERIVASGVALFDWDELDIEIRERRG